MQHFTVADGLPSNNVYSVYRDRQGFLWFGTDMGCARYNGIKFEVFTTSDGLPDNEIFSFREDNEGRLWLGTYSGLLCYYKEGRFYSDDNKPFLKLPFRMFQTVAMNVEADSSITFLFADKFKFVNIYKEQVRTISVNTQTGSMAGESIIHVRKINANKYQLYLKDRIAYLDAAMKVLYTVPYREHRVYDPYYGNDNVQYFVSDYRVYTIDEQFLFDLDALPVKADGQDPRRTVISFYHDSSTNIICTRSGAYINDRPMLQHAITTGAGRDINDDYWITTYGDGIYKMVGAKSNITRYEHTYSGKILVASTIRNRTFFTTTADDLPHLFEGAGTHETGWVNGIYRASNVTNWRNILAISDTSYAFASQKDGRVVINEIAGMRVRSKKLGKATPLRHIFISGNSFYGANETEILRADRSQFPNPAYRQHRQLYLSQTFNDHVLDIGTDKAGMLWFSTSEGTYKVIGDKPQEQPAFRKVPLRSFDFVGDYLVGIDTKNRLYVCRPGPDRLQVETVQVADAPIWGKMYPLDSLNILLSTNHYYHLLTLSTGTQGSRYTIRAIQNAFIPANAEYICADQNNVYFFKEGDVTGVALSQLQAKVPAPKVLFTGITCGKRAFPAAPLTTIDAEGARDITVYFTAISFSSSNVSYQYAVSTEEHADGWNYIDDGTISFPKLSYGTYTISIRAKSTASDYSPVRTITLVVLRPFYLSWWFLALALLAFSLLLIIATRIVFRRILLKRKREYEMNMRSYNAEYTALNALMNPHFIFNSLNNIQGLINKNDRKAANTFLMNFSTLVRRNMQNIAKGTVTLQDELDLIRNYLILEKMRFEDRFDYRIDVAPDAETELIEIPPLLIQPLVENSIKHGLLPLQAAGGMVVVHVYTQEEDVCIDVIDNGVGYHHASGNDELQHESYGLANLYKRTDFAEKLHGQKITFSIRELRNQLGRATGTIATLRIHPRHDRG